MIIDAVRTPIGRYGGVLSTVRPDDLAARVIEAVVERNGLPPDAIDDVVFGCTNGQGEDNRNVARMAALMAGLPDSVAGVTVNRLCASGLSAVVAACHSVVAGDGDLFARRRHRNSAGAERKCEMAVSSPRRMLAELFTVM